MEGVKVTPSQGRVEGGSEEETSGEGRKREGVEGRSVPEEASCIWQMVQDEVEESEEFFVETA